MDHARHWASRSTTHWHWLMCWASRGRRTTTSLYSPDFEAGATRAVARAGRSRTDHAHLDPDQQRTSTGLVIERAQLVAGPYELLTPEGLNPKLARFEDHQVQAGANYYYRVRAVTADGTLGASGDPVHAAGACGLATWRTSRTERRDRQQRGGAALASGARASLAGYIIAGGARARARARWARLNTRLPHRPLTSMRSALRGREL